MKRKITSIAILVVAVLCWSACGTSVDNSSGIDPETAIPKVCEENGYTISDEDTTSLDDDVYDGYMCDIELRDDCSIQVTTGEPKVIDGWISLKFYDDLGTSAESTGVINEHLTIITKIINLYTETDLTEEDIRNFFNDDSNITLSNEISEEDDMFYFVEKKQNIKGVTCIYYIYTYADESGQSYAKGDSIEEYFELTYNQQFDI